MVDATRANERGGARLKFILVMAVIFAGSYIAYMFLPVAYNAYEWKDLMQHKVDVAA